MNDKAKKEAYDKPVAEVVNLITDKCILKDSNIEGIGGGFDD